MWEEDTSGPLDEAQEQPPEPPATADPRFFAFSPRVFPTAAQLPHVVPMTDLYQAAHARAVADHELNKLFNPEYYI